MPSTPVQLSRAIATHLSRVRAPAIAMQESLEHLRKSAALARPKPSASAVHKYGPLVARAAGGGLTGAAADIATSLLELSTPLPWVYHYEPRCAEERLADRIAFAELIGPDGPLLAPNCRVGFTVIAERTFYPMHSHPAVELYLVVSGHAQWRTATSDRIIPPGELKLHDANEPHAMQTFDEPLLALWGWSGDVDAPAIYV